MHFRVRTSGLIGVVIMTMLLAGCSSWLDAGPRDPEVHMVKVDVIKAKLLEQRFNLRFRVDNFSDSDLIVRGLRYRIHLEKILLAEGESNEWLTIAPDSHGYFNIEVRTNLWRYARDFAKRLEKYDQPMHYRLEGELKTGLFIGYDVHISRNGEIIPGDFIPE